MAAEREPPTAVVRYRRAGRAAESYRQPILQRDRRGILTLLPEARLRAPIRIDGRVVLDPGAPVVWLTVPDAWYDVGRFHTRAGEFTGFYTNILTPPAFHGPREWETEDLLLDVWLGAGGEVRVLDTGAFESAATAGEIDTETAARARAEAARIAKSAGGGRWPPAAIREWPLERALAAWRGARSGT
jgi:predicted RNA-binding protein associated with RNAse of E/G family